MDERFVGVWAFTGYILCLEDVDRGFTIGAVKGRKSLVNPVTDLPGQVPGQKDYCVPWVQMIAHKSLTPGHPTGRPPPHQRGHWPKGFTIGASLIAN